MGRALMCDRCKKMTPLVAFSGLADGWETIKHDQVKDELVVVCPECFKEFTAFMNGAKVQA